MIWGLVFDMMFAQSQENNFTTAASEIRHKSFPIHSTLRRRWSDECVWNEDIKHSQKKKDFIWQNDDVTTLCAAVILRLINFRLET